MTDDQRAIATMTCPECGALPGSECSFRGAAHLPAETAPGIAHRHRLRVWLELDGRINPNADADRGTGVLEVRKRCVAFSYDRDYRRCDEGEVYLEAGTIVAGVSSDGMLAISGDPHRLYRPDHFQADDLITARAWAEEVRWNAMLARAAAVMPQPELAEDYSPIACLRSSFALAGWAMFGAPKEDR